MNQYQDVLQKFVGDYVRYRELQQELIEIRQRPGAPENVKVAIEQLKKINNHLTVMDSAAVHIMSHLKEKTLVDDQANEIHAEAVLATIGVKKKKIIN